MGGIGLDCLRLKVSDALGISYRCLVKKHQSHLAFRCFHEMKCDAYRKTGCQTGCQGFGPKVLCVEAWAGIQILCA